MRGYGGIRDWEAAASAAASRRTMEEGVAMASAAADRSEVVILVGTGVATGKVAVPEAAELGEFVGHMVGNAVNDAAVELSSA